MKIVKKKNKIRLEIYLVLLSVSFLVFPTLVFVFGNLHQR